MRRGHWRPAQQHDWLRASLQYVPPISRCEKLYRLRALYRATRADYIKVQTADGHTLSMLRVLASNYVRKHPGARIVRDGGQNLRLPPTAPPPDQDDGGQDDGSQDDGSQDDGGQDQSPDQG